MNEEKWKKEMEELDKLIEAQYIYQNSKLLASLMGCFIYITDCSNSSSFTIDLVSSLLALEATEPLAEPVAEPVAELAVELINNHLISVHQKR